MRFIHCSCVMGAVLWSVLAGGCGSQQQRPTGEVEGTLTFKKKPVTEGTIQFLNLKEGGTGGAELKPDGSFVIADPLPVGEYVVVVTPGIHKVDTDPGKSPPVHIEKPAPNIPQKYRMEGTTTLKAKVEPGKNVFNFDMVP
jgi:hypothetical protein